MDLKSNLPVVLYRLSFRMLRGYQPTIRLAVSDFFGDGKSRFVGQRQRFAQALMPAAAPLYGGALRDCPVASCSAPLSVATVVVRSAIATVCGVSQAASGRRGHRKMAGFVDPSESAPAARRRQPFNSRLPKL